MPHRLSERIFIKFCLLFEICNKCFNNVNNDIKYISKVVIIVQNLDPKLVVKVVKFALKFSYFSNTMHCKFA